MAQGVIVTGQGLLVMTAFPFESKTTKAWWKVRPTSHLSEALRGGSKVAVAVP